MRYEANPRLEQELYTRLEEKYLTKKPLPHLTEAIYCLTKAWWERTDPLSPGRDELLYFVVGFGLEEVLLRDPTSPPIKSEQLDGIWYTPDYLSGRDGGVDLKTTRMWPSDGGEPKKGWPETWLEQVMGYAYAMQVQRQEGIPTEVPFSIAVMYVGKVGLSCFTFLFTWEELVANWQKMQGRARLLLTALAEGRPPTPFKHNREWECEHCCYLSRCQQTVRGGV